MYCKQCGSKLPENVQFCPNCGAPICPEPLNSFLNSILNTPDHSKEYQIPTDSRSKTMCFLSYLSWLVLIPLLSNMDTKSPYIRFHTNQGLLVFLLSLAISLVKGSIVHFLLPNLFSVIFNICYVLCAALAILGLIHVYRNEAKELPLIGKLRLLKDVK